MDLSALDDDSSFKSESFKSESYDSETEKEKAEEAKKLDEIANTIWDKMADLDEMNKRA